jgi:mycothiol synthase
MEIAPSEKDVENQSLMTANLWNEVLRFDPVRADLIKTKYLDNEFARPVYPFVREDLAFALTCTRKKPFLHDKPEPTAWIMALGFRERDAMKWLLDAQEKELKKRRVRRIICCGFTPTYFFPGIDETAYPQIADFLKHEGFYATEHAIAMDKDLWPDPGLAENQFTADGICVGNLERKELPQLLTMLRRNFSSDYYYRTKVVGERGENYQIKVARERGKIVGYAMFFGPEGRKWFTPGEHFGPFGVDKMHRSRGIGAAILAETLSEMRARGMHRAYFLWTSDKASRLYARFGFKVTRRFTVFEKDL